MAPTQVPEDTEGIGPAPADPVNCSHDQDATGPQFPIDSTPSLPASRGRATGDADILVDAGFVDAGDHDLTDLSVRITPGLYHRLHPAGPDVPVHIAMWAVYVFVQVRRYLQMSGLSTGQKRAFLARVEGASQGKGRGGRGRP